MPNLPILPILPNLLFLVVAIACAAAPVRHYQSRINWLRSWDAPRGHERIEEMPWWTGIAWLSAAALFIVACAI